MKFEDYRRIDEVFWGCTDNQIMLKKILKCDEIIINSTTTETDKHIGCDAIGKKLIVGNNGISMYTAHSISLRVRTVSRYTDLNFRNHISNPNSELAKILSANEGGNYAKYFVQVFDVDGDKGKFAVKWCITDIAEYFYENIDDIDNLYKPSTKRYDVPLKQAENYKAYIYDITSGVKQVTYDYVYDKYR